MIHTDQPSKSSAHPDWGLVVAVQIAAPASGVSPQASTNANVTYDLTIYTSNGPLEYKGVSPAQARWDCWFYPAPVNSIADVYWVENTMYFKVLELPVTEDC